MSEPYQTSEKQKKSIHFQSQCLRIEIEVKVTFICCSSVHSNFAKSVIMDSKCSPT